MKNLLLAQSGGPTAAINATVAGAVAAALKSGKIDKVYAGCNGIKGVIEGRLVEIGERHPDTFAVAGVLVDTIVEGEKKWQI